MLRLLALLSLPAFAQDAPSARLARARQALDEVRGHQEHVAALLEGLSAEQASLRACVTPRAAQLDTLAEVSQGFLDATSAALADGEDGRADAEVRKLEVAAARARTLRAEAEACEGEGAAVTEPVVVEDPYADDDAAIDEGVPDDIGDDPPGASPFE